MEDKKLDDLFRQSSEHRSVPFDANAWTLMQAKLKKNNARKGLLFWFLGGLGFVVIGVFVLFTVQNSTSFKVKQTKNILQNTKKETVSQIKNNKTAILKNKTSTLDKKIDEITQKTNFTHQSNQNIKNQIAENNISNTNNLAQLTSKAIETNQTFSQFITIDSIAQDILLDSSNVLIESQNTQTQRQIIVIERLESETFNLKITDSLKIKQENFEKIAISQNKTLSHWAIQVGISPDLSSSRLLNSKKIGTDVGVLVEYHFAKRFSISTGAFYSLKNYSAGADDYKPYQGYWNTRDKPNFIDAKCDVLDIPLNIRYYVDNIGSNKFFISGGISSYWMLTEKYDYVYTDSSYPYTWTKQINNQNKHLLSVMNFSVGLQRQLSPNWSFQIEPFIKLPTNGVGYGKIKLLSSGAFLNLKYRFQKKVK